MIIVNIIWKLTNAHSCRPLLGGGGRGEEGVYSNTRVKNNCSVDSDDDFAEVIEASVFITDSYLQ